MAKTLNHASLFASCNKEGMTMTWFINPTAKAMMENDGIVPMAKPVLFTISNSPLNNKMVSSTQLVIQTGRKP